MLRAMITAMAVINIVAAVPSARAEPVDTVSVEVVKYPTPEFAVRLAEIVKGSPPNDMDIKGPPDSGRDMDGGQVSHVYALTPRSQRASAALHYDVEQNGRLLGTFRVDLKLGWEGNPDNVQVNCDEQDAPVDCYAFENPYIVRVYPKNPASNR